MIDDLTLPHDRDLEQAILAAAFYDDASATELADTITADLFHQPANRACWTAIATAVERRMPVDPFTIGTLVDEHPDWRGTTLTRTDIVQAARNAIATPLDRTLTSQHLEILRDHQRRRHVITTAIDAIVTAQRLDTPTDTATAKLAAAANDETDSLEIVDGRTGLERAVWALGERHRDKGADDFLPTGIQNLDEAMGGLRAGRLCVIGARPGMGKSALALNWAVHTAIYTRKRVLIASLEMPEEELSERVAAQLAGVEYGRITRRPKPDLQDRHWQRLNDVQDTPGLDNLLYIARRGLTATEIARTARALNRRDPVAMVLVDYIQILEPEDRRAQRHVQIGEMSRALKRLAMDLKIPVVTAAQLNREVEGRASKEPELSDLRESGSLEQDADQVLFVHRADYYDPESADGTAKLLLKKNRGGRFPVDITVTWDGQFQRFVDPARPHHPPPVQRASNGGYANVPLPGR